MNKTKELLKISAHLEKQGHHVTEIYNQAGFLQVLINGEPMSLWQMTNLWRRG